MRLGEFETTAEGGLVKQPVRPFGQDSYSLEHEPVAQDFIRALHAAHESGEVVVVGEFKLPQCGDYRPPSSGPMKLEPPKADDPFRVDGSIECRINNPEVAKAWREGQASLVETIERFAAALREAMPKEPT